MSKQLILSATLSVLAMTGAALLATAGVAAETGAATPLVQAKASVEAALPAIGALLPAIK